MRCHCGRIVSAAWSVTSAGRRPRSRGRWRLLESRCFGTLPELAAAEMINASYVFRVLRLTLLAPDMVEAILDGRQPEGMTLPSLMEVVAVEWAAATPTLSLPATTPSG